MKRFDSLALLFATSFLVLAGCGQSVIGGGGGTGGDGGDSGGGGAAPICNGQPSPVSCESTGCPQGYACVPDADPSECHPSLCDCEAHGWGCTKDCRTQGSTCQPAVTTCNGQPSPLSCTKTGCPKGWTCTPDPDPDACYPSGCGCDENHGWLCTADCGKGSLCVKDP